MTDNTPLVAAVVTTFDRFELAKRAISSVFEQSYPFLEIIVVEDGSDSGIQQWLNTSKWNREYRYIKHDTNRRLAAARNTALFASKGKYIAYLDDDDIWKPDKITRQVEAILNLSEVEREECAVVSCQMETVYSEGSYVSVGEAGNEGNLRQSIKSNGLHAPSSTFMFSSSALKRVGGFDETLPSSIDHDVWMALAASGYSAIAVHVPLVREFGERRSRASMMYDTENRIRGVKMFVDKWEPVYKEWFGQHRGAQYKQEYFVRVIVFLAVGKMFSGNFKDAVFAIRSIFNETGRRLFCIKVLAYQLGIFSLKSIIPYSAKAELKKLIKWRPRRV
jgi:glycosyltransferase involved in cell wall biosynthesis